MGTAVHGFNALHVGLICSLAEEQFSVGCSSWISGESPAKSLPLRGETGLTAPPPPDCSGKTWPLSTHRLAALHEILSLRSAWAAARRPGCAENVSLRLQVSQAGTSPKMVLRRHLQSGSLDPLLQSGCNDRLNGLPHRVGAEALRTNYCSKAEFVHGEMLRGTFRLMGQ